MFGHCADWRCYFGRLWNLLEAEPCWRRWALRKDLEVFQPGLLPASSLLPAWELNVRRCLKLLPPSLPHSDGLYPLLSCMAFVRCFTTIRKVTNTNTLLGKAFKKNSIGKSFD